jgi:hypothetical protein
MPTTQAVQAHTKNGPIPCPLLGQRGVWGAWKFMSAYTVGHIPSGMAAVTGIRSLADAKAVLERVADIFGQDCANPREADPRQIGKVHALSELVYRKATILRKGEAFRIRNPHKAGGHRLDPAHPMRVERCTVDAAEVITFDGMALRVHRWPGEPWRAHVVGRATCAMPELCTMPGEVGNRPIADPDLIKALDAIPAAAFAERKPNMTVQEIKRMTRKELIAYLESWGFQCYAHETTGELRKAALENHRTERD